MPLQRLLTRLDRVSRWGDQWRASCPTDLHEHGDRSRGLRIRELDDGTLLIWCPAGCGGIEIIEAVGLQPRDLFSDRPHERRTDARRTAELLRIARHEATVCTLGLEQLLDGRPMSDDDLDRLRSAVYRLRAALGVRTP